MPSCPGTDQLLRCFEQPVRLAKPPGAGLPRTYVHCTGNVRTYDIFLRFLSRIRADPAWRVAELQAEHTAMVTAPRELAEMLLEIERVRGNRVGGAPYNGGRYEQTSGRAGRS